MGRCWPPAARTCQSSCGTSRRTSVSRPCTATTTTSAVSASSPAVTTSSAPAGTRPSRCGRCRLGSVWELTQVTGQYPALHSSQTWHMRRANQSSVWQTERGWFQTITLSISKPDHKFAICCKRPGLLMLRINHSRNDTTPSPRDIKYR